MTNGEKIYFHGYTIEPEQDHYLVTAPHGLKWREDTITEALHEIEDHIKNRK